MAQNAEAADDAAEDRPAEPAPPISSQFLFVDVAAQRAKQLRRGARTRVQRTSAGPYELERVAMEEVRQGVIHYVVPSTSEPVSRDAV